MPVHHAAQILDLIQGAVTAIGAASRKVEKSRTPRGGKGKRVGAREATELRIGPYAAPGSLVFTLRASPLASSEVALKGTEQTDAFVDVALKKLLSLIASAESDEADSIGELASDIGRYGAMVASKLSQLADRTLTADLSLDLGHWSVGGSRASSKLSSRGAAAIVAAAARNKTRTVPVTMVGKLRTVSDGADLLRLTLDDDSTVRINVDPEIGVSLGPLLGSRVEAEVDEKITWNLASGREKSTLTLRSMRSAPPVDRLDFDMPGD